MTTSDDSIAVGSIWEAKAARDKGRKIRLVHPVSALRAWVVQNVETGRETRMKEETLLKNYRLHVVPVDIENHAEIVKAVVEEEQADLYPQVYRPGLPERPRYIEQLPLHRGFPVPWFVAWIDGVPDFRIIGEMKREKAVAERRCWICGRYIHGNVVAYVGGPMCSVNRVSAEPPSHTVCAEYAAHACPFLTRPQMRRRENGLPEERHSTGEMILRNPGVCFIWRTKYPLKVIGARAQRRGALDLGDAMFDIGDPIKVDWIAQGRNATRKEVQESLDSGMPILTEATKKDADPQRSLLDLAKLYVAALDFLPEDSSPEI